MPKFSAGEKVKVTKEATSEKGAAVYAGKVGTVQRMQQVGPGGFVVDVAFDGVDQAPALWEYWLEKA